MLMVNFFLCCLHCGRNYDLTEEAKKYFLEARQPLAMVDGIAECCDKPCYAITIPFRTLTLHDLKKLMGHE